MKIVVAFKMVEDLERTVQPVAVRETRAGSSVAANTREFQDLVHAATERAVRSLFKFVHFGEYVTIEFDTEAGTAVVLPAV